MTERETPNGWTEVSTEFNQQIAAFMRGLDGLVVSIEEGTTTQGRFAVSFLPENFYEDNRPIRSYGNNGYLGSYDREETAFDEAYEWMENNPRD